MGKMPVFARKSAAPEAGPPVGKPALVVQISASKPGDANPSEPPTDEVEPEMTQCPQCGCEFDPAHPERYVPETPGAPAAPTEEPEP